MNNLIGFAQFSNDKGLRNEHRHLVVRFTKSSHPTKLNMTYVEAREYQSGWEDINDTQKNNPSYRKFLLVITHD